MKFFQFNIKINGLLVAIFLALIFYGCNKGDKLERIVQKELATGIRNDSVFLGLEFGMSKQEFYDHCWKLNRQAIIKEGMGNMSAEYIFRDSLDQPIALNFYPDIYGNDSDEIHTYITSFYYYAWAPWHKHFQSDQMLKNLPVLLHEWYGGNEAFRVVKDNKIHYYKIDGNRLIDMYIINEREVAAIYMDMTYSENQRTINETR